MKANHKPFRSFRLRTVLLGGIVVLLAGILYFAYNPATSAFFPRCPFLMATGLKCPGCGSQRALHSLLHLDFMQAFHYNAFLVLSLPLLLLLLFAEAIRTRYPAFYAAVQRPAYLLTYLALVIGWTIVRNVFGF